MKKTFSLSPYTISLFSFGVSIVLIDALTKILAKNYGDSQIWIIPKIFSLQYVENIGVAFSFPITGIILKIMTLVLIFGIVYFYISTEQKKKNILLDIGYISIIAGAIGNGWERIFNGFVIDFFSLSGFAVFNIADIAISFGGCLLVYYYFLKK